jgi:hypothetical protein
MTYDFRKRAHSHNIDEEQSLQNADQYLYEAPRLIMCWLKLCKATLESTDLNW